MSASPPHSDRDPGPGSRTGRRRGTALEDAILDAGWDELAEKGYARLTMRTVAARARTSEPVLYRRWPDKHHLVLAVLARYRELHPVDVPDTGDLREDLVHYLSTVSAARAGYFAVAAGAAFSGLLDATGMTPEQFRAELMGAPLHPQARTIFARASARGQLDLAQTPDGVLAVPFDLVRLELLMSLEPVSDARIAEIVDAIFLPLVQRTPDGRASDA